VNAVSLKNILILLGLLAFGFLLHAWNLKAPPMWDDATCIAQQPFLGQCSNIRKVLDPRHLVRVLPVRNSARPLWLAAMLADRCFFKDLFAGYRLMALLWHLFAGILVAGLAWELSRRRMLAAAAAAFFIAHPALAEVVHIVAFSSESMALSFGLLSLLLYRRGARESGRSRAAFWAGALACYACAMLCKESGVLLPFWAALADILAPVQGGRGVPRKARAVFYGAAIALLAAYLVFHAPRFSYVMGEHKDVFTEWVGRGDWPTAKVAQGYAVPAPKRLEVPDPVPWQEVYEKKETRFYTMSRVFGSYLSILIFPRSLQADRSPEPVRDWRTLGVLGAWCMWGAWLWGAWLLRRRDPALGIGMFWVPISLLPVSGVVTLYNLQADRYLYPAAAGYCLALAAGIEVLCTRYFCRRAAAACLGSYTLVALFYGGLTLNRAGVFADEKSFYSAVLAQDPGVARAHLGLAQALTKEGRLGESGKELEETVRLWPDSASARLALAQRLAFDGRAAQAEKVLDDGLTRSPGNPGLAYALGVVEWMQGRSEEALARFQSLRGRPRRWPAALAAGTILLEKNKPLEAIKCFQESLREESGVERIARYHLALAYGRAGLQSKKDVVLIELSALSAELAVQARSPKARVYYPFRNIHVEQENAWLLGPWK